MTDGNDPRATMQPPLRWLGYASLFAVVYFAFAEIGHWLTLGPTHIATFWPPSGLYLAVLVRIECRRWPIFLFAALVGNVASDILLHEKTLLIALGFWLANTLAAVTGAALIFRSVRTSFGISRLRDVLCLALSTVLAPVLGATVGAATVAAAFEDAQFASFWPMWWVSSVVGILVVAPLLFHVLRFKLWTWFAGVSLGRAVEYIGILVVVAGVSGVIFGLNRSTPVTYFLFPILLWPALRFGDRGVVFVSVLIALIAVRSTDGGRGPFGAGDFSSWEQVLLVQTYISTASLTALVLAAVVQDRQSAMEALAITNEDLERRIQQRTEELHQTNEGLRKSEERYRLVTDTIPHMVWSMRPDLTVEFHNRMSTEFTGLTVDQVNEGGWSRLINPMDHPLIQTMVSGPLMRGEAHEVEFRFRHHTGEHRWVVSRAVPVKDEEGHVLKWIGCISDIHDQRMAEERLRYDEQRFRTLAAAVPGFLFTNRADGWRDFTSQRFYEYTGLTEGAANGQGWSRVIHPDDRARTIAHFQTCIQEKTTFEQQYRYPAADGGYRWFLARAVPVLDEQSQPKSWCGICTDIDDQKKAEEQLLELTASLERLVEERTQELEESERRFRAIFHTQFQFIGLMSPKGILLEANNAALAATGVSEESVLGKPFWETVWWRHDAIQQERLQKAVHRAARGERVRFEASHPTADGSIMWVDFSLTPFFDEDRNVIFLIPEGRDITERRRTEDTLRQQEEQMRASLREKEVLLKEIHHRVKNNLQIVSTLLDLQSDHTQDPQTLEMFQESRGRVKSMALIHERLYRSQDLARVNFADYVLQLADDLYRTYKVSDDDIALHIEVQVPPLPIDIAIPCGLIINELISNCFKHAFAIACEGWIRVSLCSDGPNTVLTVADNGAGFPRTVDFRKTTSFGLQLVNTLADQLHGEIELHTSQGSEFRITFPLSEIAISRSHQ